MKHFLLFASTLLAVQAVAQQRNAHFSHTLLTSAPPEAIWRVWTDVPNWKQWDKGLREARLEGSFAVGATGELIPDKGPVSKFTITHLVPGESYTFQTKVPGGWLIIERRLEGQQEGTQFTHEVQFTGPMRGLLGLLLGRRYRAILPEVMGSIAAIAQQSGS